MEAEGEAYNPTSARRNGPENPKALIVSIIMVQLGRSNTFSASKLRSREGVSVLFTTSMRSMVLQVLSPSCLHGTKPT